MGLNYFHNMLIIFFYFVGYFLVSNIIDYVIYIFRLPIFIRVSFCASNNNNNNNQNINLQSSSNTLVTSNINVANQINVMNMMGKRKRRKKREVAKIAREGMKMLQKMLEDSTTFVDISNN